jgi:hypothetical protein
MLLATTHTRLITSCVLCKDLPIRLTTQSTTKMSRPSGPFGAPPKPESFLEFHRVLSPTAAVRVSPLCLGAMNFGDAWQEMMGKCDKKTVFEILDFFHQQGGNFIDT